MYYKEGFINLNRIFILNFPPPPTLLILKNLPKFIGINERINGIIGKSD